MRALKAAFLILSSISLLSGQALAQNSSEKPAAVEVPMLFRGAMPAVEVMVNGQGPFLFAIDTGGQGIARLDSSLAEKLKLKAVGQIQGTDGSGRNARSMDVFMLDRVSVGGLEFKDVRAPSRNYNTSPNMPRVDGILGFNLFAEYLLTLDFPARRVRIEPGQLPKADGAGILSFDNPQGIPVVELIVGTHRIKARIDSGNSVGGFILPVPLVEKMALAASPVTVGTARTISNEMEIKEARLKESIRLGSFEFAEPTVVFPALSDDANIGSKILREFSLTFDQKNKRVLLKRDPLPKTAEQAMKVPPQTLLDYSGQYGERTISTEGGLLFIQRKGAPKLKLVPVASDEFTLEIVPEARIKFIRSAEGKVVEINVLNRGGEWEKAAKSARQ